MQNYTFFLDNDIYFKKHITLPFKSDKLDFMLYSDKKYIFLNKYNDDYNLIYFNDDLEYEDNWELKFLSNIKFVVEKSFNHNIINIITNKNIYYVNINNRNYTKTPCINEIIDNIVDKILFSHNCKIVLLKKKK